jgi:hypothetical protein
MKSLLVLVFSVLIFQFYAEDVSGPWKGTVADQFEIMVQFQSNKESHLTAKISSQIGETTFDNGKLKGDSLLFSNVSFNGITLSSLKGKVKNDTIKFVISFQGQNMKGELTRLK